MTSKQHINLMKLYINFMKIGIDLTVSCYSNFNLLLSVMYELPSIQCSDTQALNNFITQYHNVMKTDNGQCTIPNQYIL